MLNLVRFGPRYQDLVGNTFAGIAPAHVVGFVAAQLCGALIGLLLSRFLLSTSTSPRD